MKISCQNQLVLGNKDNFTGIFAELDFQKLVKGVSENRQYQPMPKFPASVQDIVVIVPEAIIWEEVEKTVKKISPLITAVSLFDIFTLSDHRKSLGFRLTLQAADRTLTLAEVKKIRTDLLIILSKEFQAVER